MLERKEQMPRKVFLDTVPPETAYYINSDCLAARPELASVLARCMATWSQIEVELSLTLAAILDTRTDAGVAVYLSIKTANTQRDALRNAALATLGGDELRAFNAVMSLHNALTPERNNLAHGIFGVMPDHPQSLIWISSAKHACMANSRKPASVESRIRSRPAQPATERAVHLHTRRPSRNKKSFRRAFQYDDTAAVVASTSSKSSERAYLERIASNDSFEALFDVA